VIDPSSSGKNAVLLLAHGSPTAVEDIPEFLLQVTNGRALPDAVVKEVQHRYSLIGASPLTCWSFEQRDLLARELGIPVYVGMRNWKPFIKEALLAMAGDGIEHTVVICLAPQNSRTSVGLYRSGLTAIGPSCTFDFVESWHNHPKLIQAFAEKLRAGLTIAEREMGGKLPIIFTAHSVPQRTIAEGDPYETQARETAALVAQQSGLKPDDWVFAFQSQGMSGGVWLGPTVEDTILELKAKGHCGVFVQTIGFLCDHVEILYDIDIGFRQFAEKQGMRLWRTESLNSSSLLTQALADIASARLMKAA
jgi:ferrochelatase